MGFVVFKLLVFVLIYSLIHVQVTGISRVVVARHKCKDGYQTSKLIYVIQNLLFVGLSIFTTQAWCKNNAYYKHSIQCCIGNAWFEWSLINPYILHNNFKFNRLQSELLFFYHTGIGKSQHIAFQNDWLLIGFI